jgi:hypothetical protein
MTVTINGTTGVAGVDGTAATPAIQGNDTNTGIFFPAADTIAFAEGGAEVARFDSSGNLGIGTSSPADKLEVNGIIRSSTLRTGATNRTLELYSGTAFNTGGAAMAIRGSATGYNDNGMEFYTSGTERMRIDSSGRLCVNTTSFITDSSSVINATSSDATTNFETTGGNGLGAIGVLRRRNGTGNYWYFVYSASNTYVGQISTNGTTTSYTSASDYRLKDNVMPMTNALARIAQLKPVTFTFKSDSSNGEGFIAHELQSVIPDAVTGEKDAVDAEGKPVYQGIDTSFLVATLTAAIQEQQAIITDLKARIETLENK